MALLVFLLLWQTCQGFEVLGVGAPRTGTQTLTTALTTLGYKTLHTGHHAMARFPVCNYLFMNGSLQAALDVLEGWDAACDSPMHVFYEEVMEAHPHAKFILTVSDAEKWYESVKHYQGANPPSTSSKRMAGLQVKRAASLTPSLIDTMNECNVVRNVFGCDFGSHDPEVKARCLDGYNRHNERVQQIIPADRLLVFNLSDGWDPLVNFLDKPTPVEAFPYTDDLASGPEVSEVTSFLQQGLHFHNQEEL